MKTYPVLNQALCNEDVWGSGGGGNDYQQFWDRILCPILVTEEDKEVTLKLAPTALILITLVINIYVLFIYLSFSDMSAPWHFKK
jgi:hypothetical protein